MYGRARLSFIGAIIVIVGLFYFLIGPLAGSIKQGLDLQGGTHIVLQAEDTTENKVNDETMQQAIQVLSKRINQMGLTEPVIQREGKNRIIIELPGVKDPDAAIKTIGKTAMLEFKNEQGQVVLTGNDLKDAKEEKAQNGNPEVAITFNEAGTQKFAALTTDSVGRPIGIYLDGNLLTNPVVSGPITGGNAVITGSQSLEEAKNLAILLRSGALPVQLKVMEVRTVGPTLGQDSKDKSLVAFAVGILLIIAFLLVLYRLSGLIATLALLIYVLLLLFILGPHVLNATLTLPGIAGIILSMGVAVDANILIFERFKEEVYTGKTLRMAIESGFDRAFSTILDANVSVMITAAVLALLGSGAVKGFAINLAIGVIVSMFTAVTMSHTLLRMLAKCNFTNHPFWFGVNVSPKLTIASFATPKQNHHMRRSRHALRKAQEKAQEVGQAVDEKVSTEQTEEKKGGND